MFPNIIIIKNVFFNCWGILVKLVICVVPGHWKIKILNLKKRNKFFCFFMFLYPIQGGKNNGSPYLTNKSWFLANLMSRDNKIKVTLVLWHPRTLFSNVLIVFCLFISSQTVSSVFFTPFKKSINGHLFRFLHFCCPGTFGKNAFLLW